MPFNTPTREELLARIRADFLAYMAGSDPFLPQTVEGVLSLVLTELARDEHEHLKWLADQLLPDRSEEDGVARWAALFKVTRKAAAPAKGNVTFTGTNGTLVPAATQLQNSDGSVTYLTDVDATISGGSATVAVTAEDAGTAGNLAQGAQVNLVTPIAGVNSAATVASGGLSGGIVQESLEEWRERVLQRIQNPPGVGLASDYERWALEVATVKKVWVYPLMGGLGSVGVYFIVEGTGAAQIPSGAKVTEVQNYLNARAPVTAAVTVVAPTALTQNFTIQLSPNTAAVQTAVQAELDDLFERVARPGAAGGVGTIPHSQLDEAVSLAAGEIDHAVTVPSGAIAPAPGQFPVRGTITWQALP